MWTRVELKTRAKEGLKNYYWYSVLATLVLGLLNTGLSVLTKLIPLVSFVISPLVTIFVTNVITVGIYSYFVKSTRTGSDAGIGELFCGFQNGRYMRIVPVMFLKSLYTFLWGLLLIVPGIIKSYEYCMIPYLAEEYPEKSNKELFQMSKQMMDGNKFKLFVLQLSFIGWILLGALACGVGLLFVWPYLGATSAELYLYLKEERLGVMRENGNDLAGSVDFRDHNRINGGQSNGKLLEGRSKSGYLVGIQGAFAGANIPVALGETIRIGRDASQCNLVIQGEQTSRLHLTVEFDGSAFRVTDLSSTGTYNLQQGRLPKGQTVILQSGTYLQLGTGGDIFMLEGK